MSDVSEWLKQMVQEQKDYYQSWYIEWCKEIERRANGDKK
jgi:hypothetical protein